MSDLSLPCIGFIAILNADERGELARFGEFLTLAKGECPVVEGDAHGRLYFVMKGKLRVVRDSAEGEVTLADLRPGDIFGEMNILDHQPASATVRALGECDLWEIVRASFEDYLETHTVAGQKLLLQVARLLAKRLRDTDARVSASPEQTLDGWW